MDRREFLKAMALTGCSFAMPGLSGWALNNASPKMDKKLLVIFLRGGVDGLNVVVPYGDSNYRSLRPTIAIGRPGTADGVLDLDGHFGLHPALEPLMPYWKDGSMGFVHACGSPDETRSHFDAQDYMESGIPGKKIVPSGWMNRLIVELPKKQTNLQALSFGPILPRIFSGPGQVATVSRANGPEKMILDRPAVAQAFQQMYGSRKDELAKAFNDGMASHREINKALEAPDAAGAQDMEQVVANKGAPNPSKTFGKQLADIFNKDGTTQIAFVDFGGWDTHINQGTGKGQLANHLRPLAAGLNDFITGIGPIYQDTTILVMSEFGRTAHENGNGGTDHGHGNVMWMLGGGVPGGKVYGRWGGLNTSDLHEKRDLPTTTDFRSVISTVLSNQLEVASPALARVFPDFRQSSKDVLVQA
jgi:uncharacterized protein (DUF1501 family)